MGPMHTYTHTHIHTYTHTHIHHTPMHTHTHTHANQCEQKIMEAARNSPGQRSSGASDTGPQSVNSDLLAHLRPAAATLFSTSIWSGFVLSHDLTLTTRTHI